MVEARTIMGQMNIVGGQWVSDVPNALAVREPAADGGYASRKGDLFVVVQLFYCDERNPWCRQLSQVLTTTVRNTYYQSPTSIAASLRRAVMAANALLLDQADSLVVPPTPSQPGPHEPIRAGVAVMAVRGSDIFVATVGPAAAYLAGQEDLRDIAGTTPQAEGDPTYARGDVLLGERPDVKIELAHASVNSGQIVILSDGRFAALAGSHPVESTLKFTSVEETLSTLGKLAGGRDCTALVVQVLLQPAAPRKVEEPKAATPISLSRPAVPAGVEEQASTKGGRAALPPFQPVDFQHWLAGVTQAGSSAVRQVWSGARLIGRALLPSPGNANGMDLAARAEMEAGSEAIARASAQTQRTLRIVAIVLPIAVLTLTLAVYWQRTASLESNYQALITTAETSYQQAVGSEDRQQARELLAQAGTALEEARTITPDDPQVLELVALVDDERDQIDNVERLYWIGRVYTYEGSPLHLRRIVVNDLDVYVLDSGMDRVYHHQLEATLDSLQPGEGNPILVERGQQAGSTVVGEIMDVIWMSAGGGRPNSSLLMLESAGLLEYNPRMGLNPVEAGGSRQWLGPVAATGYGGNFYVLDPPAGQIYRYLPAGGGYSNLPEFYFPDSAPADLQGAVDLAIDGFVYVLYADCTIHKYERGVPVEFPITGMPTPMKSCVTILAAPDQVLRFIYVADAGNKRIVQLDKQGRFLRQIKPREEDAVDFSTLKSIFVDELNGKLYFLDGRSLYIANLPPLP